MRGTIRKISGNPREIAPIAGAFIVSLLIDNELQDWLERCVWGSLTQKRFNDLKLELDELEKATS